MESQDRLEYSPYLWPNLSPLENAQALQSSDWSFSLIDFDFFNSQELLPACDVTGDLPSSDTWVSDASSWDRQFCLGQSLDVGEPGVSHLFSLGQARSAFGFHGVIRLEQESNNAGPQHPPTSSLWSTQSSSPLEQEHFSPTVAVHPNTQRVSLPSVPRIECPHCSTRF